MSHTDQRHWKSHSDFLRLAAVCLRGVVTVLVFVLFVRTFIVEGLLFRFVISGASMSPALHGPHYLLHCPKCATGFCVEAEEEAMTVPQDRPLRLGICPACSFTRVPVSAGTQHSGDRIVINRAALSLRSIRRWNVVLFRSPDDGRLTVKRVVGLPGETLEIRDGNIVINGQIATKPLAIQRAMRIPMPYGRWEIQEHQRPLSGVRGSIDAPTYELAYHPIRNPPHSGENPVGDEIFRPHLSPLVPRPSPLYDITNQLCENQWQIEPPGGIFPVRDLMFEFDWLPDDSVPLCIHAYIENLQYTIPLANHKGGKHQVVISLFDRRLLVAVDGVTLTELALDEDKQISTDTSPLAIGLAGNAGLSQSEQEVAVKRQIANLRVFRNVYFTSGNALSTQVTIPTGCYYVLGDNSSFSSDSRHWKKPFVSHRHLVGIVTAY